MWFPQLSSKNSSDNERRLHLIESRIGSLESNINSSITKEDEQDDLIDDYILLDDGSKIPVSLDYDEDDFKTNEMVLTLPKDDPTIDIPPSRQSSNSSLDFINQARQMVRDGEAKTVTAAMKKLRRREPQLHEDFLRYSAVVGREIYNEI